MKIKQKKMKRTTQGTTPNKMRRKSKTRQKKQRLSPLLYVILQLILIPSLFITVNRCSPLSPSTSVSELNSKNSPVKSGLIQIADKSIAEINALSTDELRTKASTISGGFKIYLGSDFIPENSSGIQLVLSKAELDSYLQGNAITVRIVQNLKSQKKADNEIKAMLKALNSSGSKKVVLHIFAKKAADIRGPKAGSLISSFAITEIDGMVTLEKPESDATRNDFLEIYRTQTVSSMVIEII